MTRSEVLTRLRALPPPIINGEPREPRLRPIMLCQEPGANCVAEATRGDRCAVHGANYHKADGGYPIVCARCHQALQKSQWYQIRDGKPYHAAKRCEPPKP